MVITSYRKSHSTYTHTDTSYVGPQYRQRFVKISNALIDRKKKHSITQNECSSYRSSLVAWQSSPWSGQEAPLWR